MHIHEIVD